MPSMTMSAAKAKATKADTDDDVTETPADSRPCAVATADAALPGDFRRAIGEASILVSKDADTRDNDDDTSDFDIYSPPGDVYSPETCRPSDDLPTVSSRRVKRHGRLNQFDQLVVALDGDPRRRQRFPSQAAASKSASPSTFWLEDLKPRHLSDSRNDACAPDLTNPELPSRSAYHPLGVVPLHCADIVDIRPGCPGCRLQSVQRRGRCGLRRLPYILGISTTSLSRPTTIHRSTRGKNPRMLVVGDAVESLVSLRFFASALLLGVVPTLYPIFPLSLLLLPVSILYLSWGSTPTSAFLLYLSWGSTPKWGSVQINLLISTHLQAKKETNE